MHSEFLSPHYTTCWKDLSPIKCEQWLIQRFVHK
ncbi:DUF4113 domain-containing protein [Photobacterium sagamiensis]